MKRKIINTITDIFLIAAAFAATDYVMLDLIGSENIWLELPIYVGFYALAFGAKHAVIHLVKRFNDK